MPILIEAATQLENDMISRSLLVILFFLFANFTIAVEQRQYDVGRGELLYSTYCIACHDSQVHWRDKKLATDWSSLMSEVRHWEGFARLGWTDDDVRAVTRHLNAKYYHYVAPD